MRNIFETKDGTRVVTQKPNAPILVAALFWLIGQFSEGQTAEYMSILVAVMLLLWGALELIWGVNTWRRILGASVIVLSFIRLFS